MIDSVFRDRARGCAAGAAVGDALGMPLEFGPRRPADHLLRDMAPSGRLPAGSFTDDTEMALALAESLLAARPLDPDDLGSRFVAWYRTSPPDVGIHLSAVLGRIAAGQGWKAAAEAAQALKPGNAPNGSVMRCWPVALAWHDDLAANLADSALQSRVTHIHEECVAACQFVNACIHFLLHGSAPTESVQQAVDAVVIPAPLRERIIAAPGRRRDELENSGWVRHTVESAVWGLLTTRSFEEAVVQVANLGNDADSAAAVAGALAGAAYGLEAIPAPWRVALAGQWPCRSRRYYREPDFVALADALIRA